MTDATSKSCASRHMRLAAVHRELRMAPLGVWAAMCIIVIYAICALFAPFVAPYGESDIVGSAFLPGGWGSEFLLGTDQLGRDTFSRLIYGARNTIGIALAATIISFCIGVTAGVLSALKQGWPDQLMSRLADALLAIPTLIFALMLLTVLGKGVLNLIIIIAVLDATRVFRLTRAVAVNVAVMEFVEAAKLRGEGTGWIVFREIIPNIVVPLVTEFGLRFCFVFLTISALSFLGVGIQPPTADWGSMVAENKSLIVYGILTPLYPAGAIVILAVSVNFLVDWVLGRASGVRDGK